MSSTAATNRYACAHNTHTGHRPVVDRGPWAQLGHLRGISGMIFGKSTEQMMKRNVLRCWDRRNIWNTLVFIVLPCWRMKSYHVGAGQHVDISVVLQCCWRIPGRRAWGPYIFWNGGCWDVIGFITLFELCQRRGKELNADLSGDVPRPWNPKKKGTQPMKYQHVLACLALIHTNNASMVSPMLLLCNVYKTNEISTLPKHHH